jgi:hypothetical protein
MRLACWLRRCAAALIPVAAGVSPAFPKLAAGRLPLHLLTAFNRTDSFILGKELVGENRGVDRILRSLKLHAEGRQFGDQNS